MRRNIQLQIRVTVENEVKVTLNSAYDKRFLTDECGYEN